MSELITAMAPITRRVRAYFAPVDRAGGVATLWDPAGIAGFNTETPPPPWRDLGWCTSFVRKSGTVVGALIAGAPGMPIGQVRTEIGASVTLEFESWGKLQMALTAGTPQMNVLATLPGAQANGSGGVAVTATALLSGSSGSTLNVGMASAMYSVGDLVVVDLDSTGTTGFVGSGVSGGYVKAAAAIGTSVDYIRRVSLNVGRVTAIAGGVLTLGSPLFAGAPVTGMRVARVAGFCDREGGSFFQEWSGLFVMECEQGDRIVFHYPRLQAYTGATERAESLATGLEKYKLAGSFRALPVKDASDGEMVVCFRSYLPGAMRAV